MERYWKWTDQHDTSVEQREKKETKSESQTEIEPMTSQTLGGHSMERYCRVKRSSLHTSQVTHQAGAYPSFCSMKQLDVGEFLLPPGWDASPSQGYPQH